MSLPRIMLHSSAKTQQIVHIELIAPQENPFVCAIYLNMFFLHTYATQPTSHAHTYTYPHINRNRPQSTSPPTNEEKPRTNKNVIFSSKRM